MVRLHFHILFSSLCFLWSFSVSGQKDDKIYLNNQDIITCEIIHLENNLLYVKTDHSGNYNIEWDKVDSLIVQKFLRIELQDGRVYFGSIIPIDSAGYSALVSMGGIEILNNTEIVYIIASKDKFFARIDGAISAGLSYTKASKVGTINFSGNAKYQGSKYGTEINYSNIYTKTDEEDATQNQTGSLVLDRMLPKKWFIYTSLSAESNTAQNLILRSNFGLGAGNNIIHTNFIILRLSAGSQLSREVSTEESHFNAEANFQTNFSVFRYDSPKINLTASFKLIPSINNLGRIRSEIDSKLRWELFNDFFISWTIGHRFDNQPLGGGDRTDYWVVFGLEFTF